MTFEQPDAFASRDEGIARLTLADLNGIWTFRFGPPGAAEADMSTAFARLENGTIIGGDSNFVMRGTYAFDGVELKSVHSAEVHSAPPNFRTIFGDTAREYNVVLTAQLISPDHFEGYTRSTISPPAKVVLRWFGPL